MTDRHAGYSTTINGKTVDVASLNEQQAKDALCDAYDLIEDIDAIAQLNSIEERIEKWRNT